MARCRTWSLTHGAAFTLLLLGGCGETEVTLFDDALASPPLSVTYLLEAEATHGLRSLSLSILDLELLLEGEAHGPAAQSPAALAAPVEVELVGLHGRGMLLTTRYYGPGVYTHLAIRVAAESAEGVSLAGEWLDISGAAEDRVIVELDEPLVAQWGDTVGNSLVLRLDGDASLIPTGDLEPGTAYRMLPQLDVRSLLPGELISAEDLWGGIVAVSEDRSVIQVASDASETVGGRRTPVNVGVYPSTLLFQSDGQPAPNLGGIEPDPSLADARFWVRGHFVHQGSTWVPALVASSVLLDRLAPVEPSDAAFVLEARVLERLGGGQFSFRPLGFKRGGEIGVDVLAGLNDPEVITVDVSGEAFVLGEDGHVVLRQDIHVGARAQLHFASFAGEPLEATRVALRSAPAHCGTIAPGGTSLDDWDLFLQPGAPALHAGLVATPQTPVELGHGGIFATLAVDGGRSVAIQDLAEGLRVVATGRVAGDPHAPTIDPAALWVLPGRFEGEIASISRADGSFSATVTAIHAPFGGDASAPPFRVFPAGSCLYRGDAESLEELFHAFEALLPGEALSVSVAGIATENANEVTAYEIQSRAR